MIDTASGPSATDSRTGHITLSTEANGSAGSLKVWVGATTIMGTCTLATGRGESGTAMARCGMPTEHSTWGTGT